ncbi:LemA family protein [Kordia sp. SMS9]|uniref:LemA family protein n=1 Tax=Kordia sp. SMS9 TaxID=2282170 RepID=UPI000E0DC574|nr:LemA family protein [Kordia sp. SMS9]AXG67927.1 LemA family protein [Kordia sp. SMS9]
MDISIILIAIVVIVLIAVAAVYNSLIGRRNQVQNAESSIDVMLKKRYDLIPNLVETVKQYMNHEKDLLENITALRSKLVTSSLDKPERRALESELSQGLQQLNISVENYPDLKANENFLNLQYNLNEIESQLSASRRAYNASVLDYHNGLDKFPSNIIAGFFNFKREEFFDIIPSESKNPNVKNLFDN